MKKILLLTFSLLLIGQLNAQSFAPIGASWYYTTKSDNQDSLRWIKIKVAADTLFAGKNAKVFSYTYESPNALPCPNSVDTTLLAQQADSLFFYENGTWQLLVDFNASIADTFSYNIAVSNGNQAIVRTIIARVDSVRIDSYNGNIIRSLYLRQTNTAGGYNFHDGWITEVIGHEYALLPWVNSSCAFASNYIYGIRCYSDSIIGNIQFTPFSCQAVTTSLKKLQNRKHDLILYPNPTTETLFISDAKKITQIRILDQSGRQVKQWDNPRNKLNIGELPSGLYFISLQTQTGELINQKFVKR